jgi:hypothetical protein
MTFSIILLQKFSALDDPVTGKDFSVIELAFRRGLAVLVGVLVGILVSWFVWPFRARTAVRKNLARVFQDLGLLLIKLLGLLNCDGVPSQKKMNSFMNAELSIRVLLSETASRLEDTVHERRFKGEFPKQTYVQLLDSVESILDDFESIRLGALKQNFPHIHLQSQYPVLDSLCKELVGQILLFFYVLSGAMELKTPLPPQLPDVSGSHSRLLDELQRISMQSDTEVEQVNLYLPFVLEDVIDELDQLGALAKTLFGEILLFH